MKRILFLTLLVVSLSISCLNAQLPQKTRVLVLGTPHLSSIKGVNQTHLKHLLDSLSAYKFDVIGIELMSPELILDIKSRNTEAWKELYSYYSKSINLGDSFQKKLKLDYEQASKLFESLILKPSLNDNDRKQLIYAALCTYDIWTALLNFQYVKDKASIDTSVVNLIHKYSQSTNEINLIGINLAKSLSLNNLNPIDNLQDETILTRDFPSFFTEYTSSQKKINEMISKATIFGEVSRLTTESIKSMDLFPLFKLMNSTRYMEEDYVGQWELWLKTNFDSKADKSRYYLWEMRNLQITANIMRLAAKYPEKKILVIIGASHKSFIESYLKQMVDIELLKF